MVHVTPPMVLHAVHLLQDPVSNPPNRVQPYPIVNPRSPIGVVGRHPPQADPPEPKEIPAKFPGRDMWKTPRGYQGVFHHVPVVAQVCVPLTHRLSLEFPQNLPVLLPKLTGSKATSLPWSTVSTPRPPSNHSPQGLH